MSRRGAGRRYRRSAGELESEVLAVLWTSDVPLTAAQVRRDLGDGLAHTTVVTILSRLHTKGILTRARQGRAFAYQPVADEAGLAARRMYQVLDTRADREAVLSRFVSDLSPHDEEVVRRLLGPGSGSAAVADTSPTDRTGHGPTHRSPGRTRGAGPDGDDVTAGR